MKISCTQENLSRGINIVNRLVGSRVTLPVLNNILLKSENGRLKLSATDLEIGINTIIRAKVDRDGAITIPSRLLTEFVSNNKDKNIDLELKDDTLHLRSDHYNASIKGISASEFPLIPEVKEKPSALIKAVLLREAIGQTVFAASNDETRANLMGEYLVFEDNKLKIVATDSYRLAEKTLICKEEISEKRSLIVPNRTMVELARIISDNDDELSISVGDTQILFKFGETELISRLIEGNFPDYEQIIPINNNFNVEINTEEFASGVKMASFFARDNTNNIKLKVSDQKIIIEANSPQTGSNVSEVAANVKTNNKENKELTVSFNAKFIQDVLPVIKSEKISLELEGKINPGLIRPLNGKDYLYVIMPLQLDEKEEEK